MTRLTLERDGFVVETAGDGQAGLDAFDRGTPDVVLLDVMLPGMDGVTVCRRIRARSVVPIVMLSARTDPIDVVLGLEAGADDYVTKPFEPPILAARLRAVLRRATRLADGGRLRFGDLEIDPKGMVVTRDGLVLSLTPDRVPAPARAGRERRHRADARAAARERVGLRVVGRHPPGGHARPPAAGQDRRRRHRDRARERGTSWCDRDEPAPAAGAVVRAPGGARGGRGRPGGVRAHPAGPARPGPCEGGLLGSRGGGVLRPVRRALARIGGRSRPWRARAASRRRRRPPCGDVQGAGARAAGDLGRRAVGARAGRASTCGCRSPPTRPRSPTCGGR